MKKVFDDIDNLIKKLKYNELKVIEKNYSRFVQFSVMENHKTERTEEMISMYENITKIATGSYGLLYYLDDEDEVNYSIDKCLDDANYIINNGTYVPELNGYVSFMSGKKYGFVGLDHTTGDITTFHIKNISELIKKAPSLGFER